MGKRIQNVAAVVWGVALAGAILTGCGESQLSSQNTQQDIPVSISEGTGQDSVTAEKAEETEKATQASEGYEDNFAVDSKAAEEFAEKVKDAAAQKDLEALAELTAFPVYVGVSDIGVVENKEDFLQLDSEALFTDDLLESIEMADIEDLQPNMAGFLITDGRTAGINFGVVDGALAISGINY